MIDTLGLLDMSIPLSERYDKFLLWMSTKNHSIPELLAHEIGVNPSVIDVFFMLGHIDDEEFNMIDARKLDIGALFIFIRYSKEIRTKVYENAEKLLKSGQPLAMIKAFIDEHNTFNAGELIQKVSSKCWSKISQYLKQRSIVNGTITAGFRSFLVTCAKQKNQGKELSTAQVDWIERAILHDKIKELGIFTNSALVKNFNDDYLLLKEIINNIN